MLGKIVTIYARVYSWLIYPPLFFGSSLDRVGRDVKRRFSANSIVSRYHYNKAGARRRVAIIATKQFKQKIDNLPFLTHSDDIYLFKHYVPIVMRNDAGMSSEQVERIILDNSPIRFSHLHNYHFVIVMWLRTDGVKCYVAKNAAGRRGDTFLVDYHKLDDILLWQQMGVLSGGVQMVEPAELHPVDTTF